MNNNSGSTGIDGRDGPATVFIDGNGCATYSVRDDVISHRGHT